jgi:isochorismate hydrolase
MKVSKLIEMLKKYPSDMEVITDVYSDYGCLSESSCKVIMAVKTSEYVMRSHPTMDKEHKENEKEFLYLGSE